MTEKGVVDFVYGMWYPFYNKLSENQNYEINIDIIMKR